MQFGECRRWSGHGRPGGDGSERASIAFSQTGGSLSVNATTWDGSIAVDERRQYTERADQVTAGAAG